MKVAPADMERAGWAGLVGLPPATTPEQRPDRKALPLLRPAPALHPSHLPASGSPEGHERGLVAHRRRLVAHHVRHGQAHRLAIPRKQLGLAAHLVHPAAWEWGVGVGCGSVGGKAGGQTWGSDCMMAAPNVHTTPTRITHLGQSAHSPGTTALLSRAAVGVQVEVGLGLAGLDKKTGAGRWGE